ncbi:DNA-directed RNA polymerase [Sphingomonas asaccharolytica]|uniref:DNA-directed RNA polymerase n=1 Tax=Sphingomonas asaccharolytica TaxID=40681 RepID=UPI00082B552B|nr:DNA-directed RNA polymerase [Sphingomonas asaccharolytica]
MDYTNDQLSFQQSLENTAAEAGAERYWEDQQHKANREGFERRDDVQKIIRGAIPLLSAAITGWVEHAKARKGRPSAALAPLSELDADTVAYLALSKTFNTVALGKMLSATALAIGRTIQVEIEAAMIQEADPKAARRFLKMAEGEPRESVNRKRHDRLKEQLGLGLTWSQRTVALVGGTVLNLILTTLPDIFERSVLNDHRGTVPVVLLTEAAQDQLATMTEAAAWLHPILKPMVVEPRPWVHYDTGAYLDLRLSKTVPMVRTFNREHQHLIREAIKAGEMAEVLDGLNAIQGTRFAIDQRVLNVIEWCRSERLQPNKSFPLAAMPELPKKTPREEWEALTPEARSALSRRRKALRDLRGSAAVDGGLFVSDTATAQQLAEHPCFYLPHSMDFRGRVYAVPHFNPQRSDHIKAMFRFADTVPLGGEGGRWLMIHLANCGDFEKVSKRPFDDRVQWVRDNEQAVIEAGRDPFGTYDWWSTADSPFCFLQACMEYATWATIWNYCPDFPSCISVALDGSCSGLQHYAAMTRSAEEGHHVNLLPRDVPGDIYQVVADGARPTLEACATRGDLDATTILANGFGRGEVKRNVMTYFYGSGKFGMRDQHMVDLMRPLADEVALGERVHHPYSLLTERTNKETGEVTLVQDGGFTCAQTLASHVYAAVTRVAPKADEAATWFQQVAATLAHESLPVVWRTPTGLPVIQRYSEFTSKRVNMWLYDRKVAVPTGDAKIDEAGNVLTRIECLIREAPTKRIDKKKARSAISPNVVHSLDASHLVRTVVMAKQEGIEHFQLIHDSFATHAGNTGRFFRIIREAFVDLYTDYCPFREVDRHARSVLSEEGQAKLPPIPTKGSLDLSAVLQSDYAFA